MPKENIKPVAFRMKEATLNQLDALCKANDRSRPRIIAILVDAAHAEYLKDPEKRINPK